MHSSEIRVKCHKKNILDLMQASGLKTFMKAIFPQNDQTVESIHIWLIWSKNTPHKTTNHDGMRGE